MEKIINECEKHPECAFKNPTILKDSSCKLIKEDGSCLMRDIPETWDISFLQEKMLDIPVDCCNCEYVKTCPRTRKRS